MSDNLNSETRTSVGTYLKRLREEKNLSIEDVSARLYLQAHVIEALEQDDHDSLPTGTYVYGYLQNYAKLLDTSADLVVAMYKEDITKQPEHIPERQPRPETEQSGKWPYTILYLVIFVALLLPFTWWRSQYTESAVTPGPHMDQLRGGDKNHWELGYIYTIVEHPDTHSYREPNTEQKQPVQLSPRIPGIRPPPVSVLTRSGWFLRRIAGLKYSMPTTKKYFMTLLEAIKYWC